MPTVHLSDLLAGRAAGPGEEHARRDTPPPSIGRLTGRLRSNATSRHRHDGVRSAPNGSDQNAAAPDSGGTGPGLCPEWQRARCARILRMTTGSCNVAIRRRRPPHWGHPSTSMPKARCMRADQVQAGGVDFTPASPRPVARGAATAVGSGSTRR